MSLRLVYGQGCALVAVVAGCTFVQTLQEAEPASTADAGISIPTSDAAEAEAEAGRTFVCPTEVRGIVQDTPLGAELVVGWERLDGRFVVERSRTSFTDDLRSAFIALTGATAPPPDACAPESECLFALGRIYAVPQGSTLDGLVEGPTFLHSIAGGTYRDAIVWRSDRAGTLPSWLERAPEGYSAWRCSDSRDGGPRQKDQAFTESTCGAFILEAAGDPTGDRHCDWH